MESLVIANLKHRPGRTLLSVFGVALGVILTMVTVGVVQGMLQDRGRREANVGAELMVWPSGGFGLLASSILSLPVEEAELVREIEGVKKVVVVGQYAIPSAGGVGSRLIEGVEFDAYAAVSKIILVEGGPLHRGEDEAAVDLVYAQDHKLKLGDKIDIFGRPFALVAIYTPESGPRIKIPLDVLQSFLAGPDRCSALLVKCEDPDEQELVAKRIGDRLSDRLVIYTRDLPLLYSRATPAINTFLHVVVGLEAVIGVLVILLVMYTAIAERRREVGILKSLGASRTTILGLVEREALVVSFLGALVGCVLSFGAKLVLTRIVRIPVEMEAEWLLITILIALTSGFLGALYPALLAARQDPVKALSYE